MHRAQVIMQPLICERCAVNNKHVRIIFKFLWLLGNCKVAHLQLSKTFCMANWRHFKKLGVEFVLSQIQWIAMISSIKSRQTMSVLKTCHWEYCTMFCCSAACSWEFLLFLCKEENATAFHCRMFKHFFTLNWLICDGSNSAPSVSFTLDIWGLKMKELSNRQIELRNGHQCLL